MELCDEKRIAELIAFGRYYSSCRNSQDRYIALNAEVREVSSRVLKIRSAFLEQRFDGDFANENVAIRSPAPYSA
jgi:hypothetical protein